MPTTSHHPLAAARWQLDPAHSTAEFHVRTFWGLTTVHGTFHQLAGRISADGQMELTVDASSLETGNQRRDEHLRSADFFDIGHHPHVRFYSTRIDYAEDGSVRVAGELGAAGQRVRIELHPAIRQLDDEQLEIDAETMIDQRQLGMTYQRFGIRTPATVALHARLHRVANQDHAS